MALLSSRYRTVQLNTGNLATLYNRCGGKWVRVGSRTRCRCYCYVVTFIPGPTSFSHWEHWATNFYKSHVSEIKLVISYQLLCAEHEYDIQIAKLALAFVITLW